MKVVMEAEEIQQAPACKFPRVGNGRNDSIKIGSKGGSDHYPDDEEDGELNRACNVVGGSDAGGNANRLRGWNHSRIIRVSRASGGKDRHNKVWTSKGLRDWRVRLSVTTATQFYDLQDRLGYDQPSKAVEWLIKATTNAIPELPSLNTSFPDTPKQLSDEKQASGGTEQGFDSVEVELDGDPNFQQNQSQHLSLSKSTCSSTSKTSKGFGLSLSRSEILPAQFLQPSFIKHTQTAPFHLPCWMGAQTAYADRLHSTFSNTENSCCRQFADPKCAPIQRGRNGVV